MTLLLTLSLALAGAPASVAAPQAMPPASAPPAAARPAPQPPARAVPRPHHRGTVHRRHGASRPVRRVRAANLASTREPAAGRFAGASQVYAWSDGALYRLYTAPERVSDVALQTGETLLSVAAGDTVRWVIGDTASGAGADRRVHILVKPSEVGLETNMVVMTDRRVYHIQLESVAAGAMAGIAWSYPADALMALRAGSAPTESGPESLALDRLNFGYRIEGGDPPWRPLRVFDDGRQLFIEFPEGISASEAPPLFVLGEKGAAELVNYRMRGRFYVVDKLFAAAELRLGAGKPQVVRIVRDGQRGHSGRRERRS